MGFSIPTADGDIVWQYHQYKSCGAHAGNSSSQNCGVGAHAWAVATLSAAMPASGTQDKTVWVNGTIEGYSEKKRKGELSHILLMMCHRESGCIILSWSIRPTVGTAWSTIDHVTAMPKVQQPAFSRY
jgi:hypothetical protein